MGWPVVTVASGGMPVVDVTATTGRGTPVTEATNAFGRAVTKVASGGMPVAYETLTLWPPNGGGGSVASFDPATATGVTLSNNNLTATHAGAIANSGVRVSVTKNTGKYYYEVKAGVIGGDVAGFAAPGATYTQILGTGVGIIFVSLTNGNLNCFGSFAGNIGGFLANDIAGLAIDIGAGLVWIRKNVGNWNGSGTASPATGIGGTSFTAGSTLAPVLAFNAGAGNETHTANFGATAYANAAPSGFGNWPVS